jgi:hypothetical protein
MEVHHHSHTSRKKWSHYFWEFLMLFLAVFCGFLAEYQLEHKIEKDREKQYMQSMLEDLAADTFMLKSTFTVAMAQKRVHDSILHLIYYQQPLNDSSTYELYNFHYSTRVLGVSFEDRSKVQLKNSGSMRLVRKRNVNDSILLYWKRTEALEGISERISEIGNEITSLSTRIFHTKYLIPGEEALSALKGITPDAKLIHKDPLQLEEYANLQYLRRTRIIVLLDRLTSTKIRAIRLMDLIRKEYHIR